MVVGGYHWLQCLVGGATVRLPRAKHRIHQIGNHAVISSALLPSLSHTESRSRETLAQFISVASLLILHTREDVFRIMVSPLHSRRLTVDPKGFPWRLQWCLGGDMVVVAAWFGFSEVTESAKTANQWSHHASLFVETSLARHSIMPNSTTALFSLTPPPFVVATASLCFHNSHFFSSVLSFLFMVSPRISSFPFRNENLEENPMNPTISKIISTAEDEIAEDDDVVEKHLF
ncbi:hypothetical protein V8G54_014682 [Vigna mungo]|uniref:Uncharacterized protein n=1 Tax=Vigna mungo TaxID=3915 RepID=A0AAQ3NI58_VIGMU